MTALPPLPLGADGRPKSSSDTMTGIHVSSEEMQPTFKVEDGSAQERLDVATPMNHHLTPQMAHLTPHQHHHLQHMQDQMQNPYAHDPHGVSMVAYGNHRDDGLNGFPMPPRAKGTMNPMDALGGMI